MNLSKRVILVLIVCTSIGYIIGMGWGLSTRENRTEFIDNCLEWDGPHRPDFRSGEGPICLEYGAPTEITERPIISFFTYGLIGAFFGAWVGVFIQTYILKE